MKFRCPHCDQEHDELPHIGADYPDPWFAIPEADRAARVEYCADACVIDNKYYLIRGVIEIPVHGQAEPFGWGVWVSQKKENFAAYMTDIESATIGPFFGWLCTRIWYYQPDDTLHLKTMAHFVGNKIRPRIVVEPTDHPLAVHQRNGIALEKAWEIVHFFQLPAAKRQRIIAARTPAAKPKPAKERN